MRERIVVVGTDGTAVGNAVVRQGAVVAQSIGASLHVVVAEPHRDRAAEILSGWQMPVRLHDAEGDLDESVWAAAARLEANWIVIDRSGSGRLGRLLSGARWRVWPGTPRSVQVIDLAARLPWAAGAIDTAA